MDVTEKSGTGGAAVNAPRRQRAPARAAVPLSYDMPDVTPYIISKETSVPIEMINFDFAGKEGQARPLNLETVSVRLAEIKKNMPDDIVPTKLWEKNAGV